MADQEKKPEAEQGQGEAKKEGEKTFWDRFDDWGKRFVIVATLVAAIWAGIQFFRSNDAFDVDLIYGPFSAPPQLADKLPADAKPAFQPLKGQITLSIKNVSGRPVEDVGIQGQGKGFALVDAVFEGKKYPSEFSGRLEVGQMPAEATVIVTLWVDLAITPAYPVVIDHKAGFQTVALRSASIMTYISMGFIVVFWILLFVFIYLMIVAIRWLAPILAEVGAFVRKM